MFNLYQNVVCVIVLMLLCSVLKAQMNYQVTGGSQGFVAIGAVPVSQQVDLTGTAQSQVISPPGFSFTFDGVTQTEFIIYRFGALGFGASSNLLISSWDPSSRHQQVMAPFQYPLSYVSGSQISWDFQGGVLTVEWLDVQDFAPPAGAGGSATFSFQVVVDTNSGAVEFRYGSRTGPAYPVDSPDFAVALTGTSDPTGKVVIPGVLNGFVDSEGAMSDWPSNSFIAFTPTGLSRSQPSASVESNLNPVSHDGGVITDEGETVASLNLTVLVGDADGDQVSVRVWPINADWTESEFESPVATVPYSLSPTSGTLNTVGSNEIVLICDDGLDGRRIFYFRVLVTTTSSGGGSLNIPGPVAEVVGPFLFAGLQGGCVSLPDQRAPLALLAALVGIASWRRLRRTA